MQNYKNDFIQMLIERKVLQFGTFTLKSGRTSPYFFNAGLFNDGYVLAKLGEFYAHAIKDSKLSFDILYGPAYKGIPLVATTAIAFYSLFGQSIPYCYNRKEAKKHGEGGNLVGAEMKGRVLIIDDVITAGTAIRESVEIIKNAACTLAGSVIALDRQEKGVNGQSAIQEIEHEYGISITSIITLGELLAYMEKSDFSEQDLANMRAYRDKYAI